MNLVENILSIYYKYALSVITDKLDVSGHMLILQIFLILVCGTRGKNLSLFIYALYIAGKKSGLESVSRERTIIQLQQRSMRNRVMIFLEIKSWTYFVERMR
jgi:hypothetical protein